MKGSWWLFLFFLFNIYSIGSFCRFILSWFRLLIEFEGVMVKCKVVFNGVHLAGHLGGYTRFSVDLTPRLRFPREEESGDESEKDPASNVNTLIVTVDGEEDPSIPPFGTTCRLVTGIVHWHGHNHHPSFVASINLIHCCLIQFFPKSDSSIDVFPGNVVDFLPFSGIYREASLLTARSDVMVAGLSCSLALNSAQPCQKECSTHTTACYPTAVVNAVVNVSLCSACDDATSLIVEISAAPLEGPILLHKEVKVSDIVLLEEDKQTDMVSDRQLLPRRGQIRLAWTVEEASASIPLWDVDQPSFTFFSVSIITSAKQRQCIHSSRIGLREQRWENGRLYLNSKPIRIFGLNRHQVGAFVFWYHDHRNYMLNHSIFPYIHVACCFRRNADVSFHWSCGTTPHSSTGCGDPQKWIRCYIILACHDPLSSVLI